MITLRSITGKEFFLNSDLIYRIDENFDTIITLTNGKTLPVADTGVEITEKVIAYKREIMSAFILERKDSE
ncbi:endoflagellar protein [Jeotgalibaca sp. PTS2502]|uniref:flagellar FlbD family protein n=1 Tax=Jeotgalibaca sp. PTS2502 TaxID=1903686 RepID=UPI000973A6A8|nr:flagellar FlbD family protein [Jeotgalibaca sp. PTS2502]APZ49641.1 endoflagellar protein [Jeotgalibaca sp. PTS2502]